MSHNLYQMLNAIVHNQQALNEMVCQLKHQFNFTATPVSVSAAPQSSKAGRAINSSHIAIVLGCRKRTAQKKLRSIRIQLGKPVRSTVTAFEFAKAAGVPLENVVCLL